jgi:hypothetical protein
MRAISPIGNYSIQLVEARVKRGLDKTGTVVEFYDGESVLAQFHKGGLTEWEELTALESFDFSGLPDGINPLTRVSMFDSEAYVVQKYSNAEERELRLAEIDERLVYLGKLFPNEFRIVEKPAAVIPWPSYNETPIEDELDDDGKIATPGLYTMQSLTGISPQAIRLYEVENLNRPEVIEAMEALELAALGAPEAISVSL